MKKTSVQRNYGWIKQKADPRDLKLSVIHAAALAAVVLPPAFSRRQDAWMPPVYDQGQLGSCTGNGGAGAFHYELGKQKLPVFPPSRLFIYYNERVIEGTVSQDAGAEIRDCFKVISNTGVCAETTWPYDVAKFAKKPPPAAFTEAKKHTAVRYMAVAQTRKDIQSAVYLFGLVVIGFTVYPAFESDAVAKTGTVPMPKRGEQAIGGHCVCIVGYDNARGVYICRNSWGADWGDGGYFTLPYAYVESAKYASDFWVVEAVQ